MTESGDANAETMTSGRVTIRIFYRPARGNFLAARLHMERLRAATDLYKVEMRKQYEQR